MRLTTCKLSAIASLAIFLLFLLSHITFADTQPKQLAPPNNPPLSPQLNAANSNRINFENFGFSSSFSDYLNTIFTQSYFLHGFLASLAVIIVSELGDKTFFIAAILAMRHSRCTVLAGALSALAVMTVLAALLGHVITFIPRFVTFYVSSILLLIFGLRMLNEAHSMAPDAGLDEMEEVQAELKMNDERNVNSLDPETGVILGPSRSLLGHFFSKVFLQSFTLTFLAEWGDRSQLATIILAAREHVGAVIIGGVLGHLLCTGLAVLGGRIIAQRISVRVVTFVGGLVFLGFGLSAFYFGP